jgi:hypothetical protein
MQRLAVAWLNIEEGVPGAIGLQYHKPHDPRENSARVNDTGWIQRTRTGEAT